MTTPNEPEPPPENTPDTSATSTDGRAETEIRSTEVTAEGCPQSAKLPNGSPSKTIPDSRGEEEDGNDSQQHPTPSTPHRKCSVQEVGHKRNCSTTSEHAPSSPTASRAGVSEWSHQRLAAHSEDNDESKGKEMEWQTMPAYAPFDIYDDDGKLVAREAPEESEPPPGYTAAGGPAKGYTRVQDDEDDKSTTSLDENTAYLFRENKNELGLDDEDEEARDRLSQMKMTKDLLTDNQRIAYVGLVKLAMVEMDKEVAKIEKTRGTRKQVDLALESILLWGQKMMVRLYSHMEVESAEQVMIEQLAEHGLEAKDLTPSLMSSSTVKNPAMDGQADTAGTNIKADSKADVRSYRGEEIDSSNKDANVSVDKRPSVDSTLSEDDPAGRSSPPPVYKEVEEDDVVPQLQDPSELSAKENLEIDLRWTVLCDFFLILISDAMYDARSRTLLEKVAGYLGVSGIDIARFEKRVTEALEMEEEAEREGLNEDHNIEKRRKRARNRRLAMMGLATVGGGLVIGLSAGLMAPLIGAGLAAGFTTIGVSGTSTFLAGAGGAAIIGTAGTVTGGTVGVRAASRRTGAVKTFEYQPLHNNKRVNLIVTVAGWMKGKVDDVRLPFSTVDPIMGDIFSVLWEPEMMRSMGDTINILATEALTQGLQQLLGSTILIALMAALQVPIVLSKLSYLIDNPWSVSVARADAAGLILADSLIERNLGARPITLVGFSLGSRVIFGCLKELANKGALGLIQNVFIFGTPVVVKKDEYLRARTAVSGRFVNGYNTTDWILGYLFRATGGGIMRVAGLAKVEIPGIENVDVTQHVNGHMAYRNAMPKLLRELGWAVTSDEFTEIEDPDPDNHEKRQRELVNEIEEARKKLEEQPEKRRFGIFSRPNKKRALKKNWEMYDESFKQGNPEEGGDPNGALFDVNAIRREAIELAAEGIEIKELESTMPPMKIASDALSPPLSGGASGSIQTTPALSNLTRTNTIDAQSPANVSNESADSKVKTENPYFGDYHAKASNDQLHSPEEDVNVSFEPRAPPPSLPPKPVAGTSRSPSPQVTGNGRPEPPRFNSTQSLSVSRESLKLSTISLPDPSPYNASRTPSPSKSKMDWPYREANGHAKSPLREQAPSQTLPVASPRTDDRPTDGNPWIDEDDGFGEEKEVTMSFE